MNKLSQSTSFILVVYVCINSSIIQHPQSWPCLFLFDHTTFTSIEQCRQKHIVINNYFASFTKHSFLRTHHQLSLSCYYHLCMFLNSPSISLSFANILLQYTIEFISFPLSLSFYLCHLCILSKHVFNFPNSLFLQLSCVYFLFYFTCFYDQRITLKMVMLAFYCPWFDYITAPSFLSPTLLICGIIYVHIITIQLCHTGSFSCFVFESQFEV